jgi:hypothetical protein
VVAVTAVLAEAASLVWLADDPHRLGVLGIATLEDRSRRVVPGQLQAIRRTLDSTTRAAARIGSGNKPVTPSAARRFASGRRDACASIVGWRSAIAKRSWIDGSS